MVTPTPTPEWRPYVVAIVVVFSLASTSLASKVQPGVATARELLRFLGVHSGLMVSTVALAAFCGPALPVAPWSLAGAFWQSVTGLALGHIALVADNKLIRYSRRWERGAPGVVLRQTHGMGANQQVAHLILLCAVAILEEVLFRGVLVELSFRPASPAVQCFLLALNVPLFAMTHAYGGLVQVIAKIPLGLFCLVTALTFHTLLAPLIIHLHFNLSVSRAGFFGLLRRSPK